ncbi:MAG: hypothetical protein GC204_12935 [Chloroflexi bacterium]|nr:hypothetical protein [Chloroflexota bacterium]
MRHVRLFSSTVLIVILLALTTVGQAQDASTPPEFAITVSADGVVVPENISAGLTTITFTNETDAAFSPLFIRLNDGVTMDQFGAAMGEDNPSDALALVSVLGGLEAAPGASTSTTYALTAGNYVVGDFASDAITPFTVAPGSDEAVATPEPNDSDVLVTFVDFAFGIPDTLPSGEHVWQFSNKGNQPHEMGVFKVEDDATIDSVQTTLMGLMASQDDSADMPYEQALFWTPMSPGAEAWTTVDLEPGTYVAVCFFPDLTSDMMPHMMKGMIKLFTVE